LWKAATTAGLIVAAAGVAALAIRHRASSFSHHERPVVDVAAPRDDDLEPPPIENPGYVGMEACAACHAGRVDEFRATNHSRTFRVPDPAVMPAGFAPGKNMFTSQIPGLRFEMTRAGNEYFQNSIRTTPEGRQDWSARIDLVLGAGGKADEVYLTWHGDRLYELPLAWLFTFNGWGCSSINPHGSGEFSRESTLRCLECHNTWFEHKPGTLNGYRRDSFLMGVTCENCHGPGRDHVAFHQEHPGKESGERIVKPARLARERQLEVCTQCHSNALRHKGPALSYRPGTPLDDFYQTLRAPEHIEDDHVANQIKYLRQSRCFQNSNEMTCTTCHDPHRPERAGASGIESCLKCHRSADCGEQARLPEALRTRCVDCHMPSYIKINVNFETEDDRYVPPIRRCDHRIAIRPRARDEVLRDWYRAQGDPASGEAADRLTRSLVEDRLAEAETCRRDHRLLGAIAALREAYRLEPATAIGDKLRDAVAVQTAVDRRVAEAVWLLGENRQGEAADALIDVLQVLPTHARAHGRLGTAYARLGKEALAVREWTAVAKYDADDPYGHSMLGWQAYLQDRAQESLEDYRRADEADPHNAQINYRWGLALLKLRRWREAAERFQQVVSIDPNHAGGQQGLAHALRQEGGLREALRHARRAARLTDFQNADVLLTLTDVYADLGEYAEAADAAEKALAAARTSAPDTAPQIGRRLEELRQRRSPAP
jgi:tetratricopeptide (TPR) repeat protein